MPLFTNKTSDPHWAPPLWATFASAHRTDHGAVLAALRQGLGKRPGTVPSMWPYYTTDSGPGDSPSREFVAEHIALSLFGLHQQGKDAKNSMHRREEKVPYNNVGSSIRRLAQSGKFSEEAVSKRFAAFATASSIDELQTHLRSLVSQLSTVPLQLDYTELKADLTRWQAPGQKDLVARKWGRSFYGWQNLASTNSND